MGGERYSVEEKAMGWAIGYEFRDQCDLILFFWIKTVKTGWNGQESNRNQRSNLLKPFQEENNSLISFVQAYPRSVQPSESSPCSQGVGK